MNRSIRNLALAAVTALGIQGTSAQDGAALEYVTWYEPTNAYTVEVPDGWLVDGVALDVPGGGIAPNIFLFSPESAAVVVVGSGDTELYAEPDAALGLVEGDSLLIGDGLSLTVAPYESPLAYLETYLRHDLLMDVCATLTITDTAKAEGEQEGYEEGELTLDCAYADGSATGYFYANIYATDSAEYGVMWMVGDVYGYLAEPGYEAQAETALVHLLETYTPAAETVAIDNTISEPAVTTAETQADPDTFSQAQYDAYMEAQTSAMISNMMTMQHETTMTIINNIGGSGNSYEWQYEYDYP